MSTVFKVTKEDFAAAKAALGLGEYSVMDMLANRLMANAVYGESSDRAYALPGYFIKETSIKLRSQEPGSSTANKISLAAESLVKNLESAFTEELNLEKIWNCYGEFVETTRVIEQSNSEKKAYSENRDFTASVLDYLIGEVLSLDTVCEENSQVFKGSENEIMRVVRVHGATTIDLMSVCLVTAFGRLHDYAMKVCHSPTGVFDKKRLEGWLEPFLTRVQGFHSTRNDTDQLTAYQQGSSILIELVHDWRLAFIKYFEINPHKIKEQRIELPQETKDKIGKTISEALKKDLVR